ncbi:hypothetical protein [Motilimonas eburnea]|uniref:hypothetical protein n=1 Tax=Motilimonas eburnea TaxID=1737488 RepID=UPI001E421E32|nr:hypothetical protein [Motilimonas eburnea]MCE2573640.1 hypothetical protein [Motilimonas eburnea]
MANSIPQHASLFIIPPQGVIDMLEFLQSDDYNQRVKDLAYQQLATKYGIDKHQADRLSRKASLHTLPTP